MGSHPCTPSYQAVQHTCACLEQLSITCGLLILRFGPICTTSSHHVRSSSLILFAARQTTDVNIAISTFAHHVLAVAQEPHAHSRNELKPSAWKAPKVRSPTTRSTAAGGRARLNHPTAVQVIRRSRASRRSSARPTVVTNSSTYHLRKGLIERLSALRNLASSSATRCSEPFQSALDSLYGCFHSQ